MSAPRRGLSVLEVIIAMSMFSIIMLAVLQSLSSMRGFISTESTTNDLTLESRRVMRELVNDLGNSAWLVTIRTSPPAAKATDLADLLNPAKDRLLRYYPFVVVQSTNGFPAGTQFAAWQRTAANVLQWTDPWFNALPAANRLPSQELIFLRVQHGPPNSSPIGFVSQRVNFNRRWDGAVIATDSRGLMSGTSDVGDGSIDWRDGVQPMSQFKNGVKVPSLTVKPDIVTATVVGDTPMVMESFAGSTALTNPALRFNPDYLREYSYVVVPNANSRKGRLERRWRDGTGAVVVPGEVLSENVDRIVIDTYRTLSSLNVNQVRIQLYMSKEAVDGGARFVSSRIDATVALRSTVDPEYSLNLGTWLGNAGLMRAQGTN